MGGESSYLILFLCLVQVIGCDENNFKSSKKLMGLVKYFCLMSLSLVMGLVGWALWEWTQWPLDFSQYVAEPLLLPNYDSSFRDRIDSKYFLNATVIRHEDSLRYPEDIAVTNDGTIYTALHDNTIAVVN